MARFRFYYDGKLQGKTTEVTPEQGARYLQNLAADWRQNLRTREEAAALEHVENNAVEVELTENELRVETTEGHKLVWRIV